MASKEDGGGRCSEGEGERYGGRRLELTIQEPDSTTTEPIVLDLPNSHHPSPSPSLTSSSSSPPSEDETRYPAPSRPGGGTYYRILTPWEPFSPASLPADYLQLLNAPPARYHVESDTNWDSNISTEEDPDESFSEVSVTSSGQSPPPHDLEFKISHQPTIKHRRVKYKRPATAAGGVAGSGPRCVPKSGSGDVAGSGLGGVTRSESGAMAGSGLGGITRSGSGGMTGSRSGGVADSGSGGMAGSGSGGITQSGSGGVAGSGSGGMAGSGSGGVVGSGSGGVAESGTGDVAESGSGGVAESGTGAEQQPSSSLDENHHSSCSKKQQHIKTRPSSSSDNTYHHSLHRCHDNQGLTTPPHPQPWYVGEKRRWNKRAGPLKKWWQESDEEEAEGRREGCDHIRRPPKRVATGPRYPPLESASNPQQDPTKGD